MGGWSGSTGLLRWFPVTPDRVELQDDEPDQCSPPSPFVPHLLEETEHPVGSFNMVIGPNPLTDRVVQIRHQLGKLLFIQLFHSLDEFGHGLESRITYDRRQATTCLVNIFLCVEKPVHSICELSE